MKRILSLLLVAALLIGLAPAALATGGEPDQDAQVLTADEVSGTPRLDELDPQTRDAAQTPAYEPDEMVTVIVELAEAPTLDRYEAAPGLAGEAVSQYLASSAVKTRRSALLGGQDAMVQSISRRTGTQVEVVSRWTDLLNAMAIQIPYGQLETIRSMDGVKRAYVEHVYERPEEELSTDAIPGTYGCSYNMVGLGQVWEAGFTGKGMLVAVLDTGLDLNYTSWGSVQDPVTGVRRVHEAFTDDSFLHDPADSEEGWDLRYTGESLRLFLESTQLQSTTGADGDKITYSNNALYKNRKVPYACDYADGDINVQPAGSDHGTHVSGTVAGYAESEEGEILFSGVAPDAQILAMKVFPDSDSGAPETAILNALEDAASLGADVVNLSLGSDNGFAEDDAAANEAYARLQETGIIFMTSAGNASYSSANNQYGGYPLVSDPEISMMSAPAVYSSNLSVASIDNTIAAQSVLVWTDGEGAEHKAAFSDTTEIAMKYKFAGKEPVEIIPVDGYGTYNDYAAAGFNNGYNGGKTGVALVKRGGGISFLDKINNAMSFSGVNWDGTAYGVLAVIVYDEDPNATDLIYMSTDGAYITSAFISGKDGHAIVEAAQSGKVTMTVLAEDEIVSSDTGYQMSVFSSWGAGPGLELKPEITAPGGNIWSAVVDQTYSPQDPGGYYDDYTGAYGMMSGTSMAAPHMTGLAALVEQYVQESLQITSKTAASSLTSQLLVSTALPQKDPEGVYYSPRLQGAGLVNAAGAVTTPAYISVAGQNVGKLELKDDPEKTGRYTMNFEVHNLTDEPLTYTAKAAVLRPDTGTAESRWGEASVMLDSDVLLREVDLGTVTVPASGSVQVSKTVTLTQEEKALLDSLFANGAYVEGFVILTDSTGEHPQIGLPFLAFYGDWTAAPIFDSSMWYDTPEDGENVRNNPSTWATSILGSVMLSEGSAIGFVDLGQNMFDSRSNEQSVYHQENFAISPNGDGYLDQIDDFILYQLREAKLMVVEVRDKQTNELYYRDYATYQFKSLWNSAYSAALPSSQYYFTNSYWDGTDLNGNVLPSGTECVYSITAYGEGDYGETVWNEEAGRWVTDFESIVPGENEPTFHGHAMDLTGDVISFDIQVDTVAPKLENNTVSVYEEDGRTYMTGTVYDDGSIASVEIHPLVKRTYTDSTGKVVEEYGLDMYNPFYSQSIFDPDTKTYTFTADVTEYTGSYEWTGNVYISCGDYGLNDRTYAVKADPTQGLVLSQVAALMHPGEAFDLSVNDNTGLEGHVITRTSSNPEVATIDEFGRVEALAPGQTVITVSAGEDSAVCVVAVKERTTELQDFQLSVESFSGLKPNGSIVVKATDLYPADAEITTKRWEVNEDDPDLYAGLITCSQNSSDGLSAELYLNYSATGDPDILIPGASATLEVTLNGVTRTMKIDWEDLYTNSSDEDLVSGLSYGDQSVYVTQGSTATLVAKYNDTAAHIVAPVALCTAKDYNSSSDHTLDPAEGLILDGPDFCGVNSSWTGKLVHEEGYALPESIRVFTRYESGYEYEMTNSWRKDFTYDSRTGEIQVYFTPPSKTNTLVIRADGVVSPGNPAGTSSGTVYERPTDVYGPFDWEIVSGRGELTTEEGVNINGTVLNAAYYTPSEPGISYIRATTKDGQYSLDFAVVSEAILPEKLELDTNRMTLSVAESRSLSAVLSPTPTLEKHTGVQWESFDPGVATVDETGTVTGVSQGYAYIRAVSQATGVQDYCIVEVLPCAHEKTKTETVPATCTEDGSVTVTCEVCGAVVSREILPKGHQYEAVVTAPTCTEGGYTTYTCSVCGDSYVDDHTDALGHDFQVTVVEAQEGAEGYTQHTCLRCGYSYRDGFTEALACPSAHFTDVDTGRWYHEGVDFAVSNGLMKGVSDTQFRPEGILTRGQIVTILYRLAGEPESEGTAPFTDVSGGRYYAEAVAWAYEAGIGKGLTDTVFAPNAPVTREQLVTFLARYAQFAGEEISVTGDLTGYPDASGISSYAVTPMTWAVEQGLLKGMEGRLAPKGTATRAQIATILQRYCEAFSK